MKILSYKGKDYLEIPNPPKINGYRWRRLGWGYDSEKDEEAILCYWKDENIWRGFDGEESSKTEATGRNDVFYIEYVPIEKGTEKKDMVNEPPHYTSHPAGVECIDIIEHFPANIANAMKYLWRQGLKFNAKEDLEKAIWYINREIKRQEGMK